ncbi:MAG: hypothetical protein BWZ10_01151 [candidate division BRC1 bacterium ADurb.BinA364]|nr:MAG: hypothetical protein BWZ10_01151 [candidate division BRC1 bacterium ADurb.BinA364]
MAQASDRETEKKSARARLGDEEKQIAAPLSPEALEAYGQLPAPAAAGGFDPEGAWRQVYRIWMTGGPSANYRGYLALERQPAAAGSFALNIEQVFLSERMRAVHETSAQIQCSGPLAVPSRWRLSSRVRDFATGEEYPEAAVEQEGALEGETLWIATKGEKKAHRAPAAWTANWTLFEALQRLPRSETANLKFDLLDDLDIWKTGHRLAYRGEESVLFGGQTASVARFDQIGRGCLPQRYYVDGQGRLLLSHTALRAYILDPAALDVHAAKIEALQKKEMK